MAYNPLTGAEAVYRQTNSLFTDLYDDGYIWVDEDGYVIYPQFEAMYQAISQSMFISGQLDEVDGYVGLATSGVTPGSYTATNLTVDAYGRITAATNGGDGTGTVTSVATTARLTGGPITTTGTLDLATSGVTAGSYTATNLTVDAYGRITSATSGTSGVSSVTANNSSLTISPTTGAVLANINLANTNTYTVKQGINFSVTPPGAPIGNSNVGLGLTLYSNDDASSGNPKYSPALSFHSDGYNTSSPADVKNYFTIQHKSVSGSLSSTGQQGDGYLSFMTGYNNAAYQEVGYIDSAGNVNFIGSATFASWGGTTLSVKHLDSTGTAPTGSTNASVITGTITVLGGDMAGNFKINRTGSTGLSTSTTYNLCTITFNTAYASTPSCVLIQPANGNSVDLTRNGWSIWIDPGSAGEVTTTLFKVKITTPSSGSPNMNAGDYMFFYTVIE